MVIFQVSAVQHNSTNTKTHGEQLFEDKEVTVMKGGYCPPILFLYCKL